MIVDTHAVDIRDAFFDEVFRIASDDKNLIFITADADAFSLRQFKKALPDQFINVGVAEQNMISVASGLALSGKKVFVYAIIPFVTMRCYEQIKVNICSMKLPVTIVGAGAGLSFGNDGPTHHAVCDIAVMRVLPEMTILNPSDSRSAYLCARAAYDNPDPSYVRLDKGTLPAIYNEHDDIHNGIKVVRPLSNVNIISTGLMTHRAVEVADTLSQRSVSVGVIDLVQVKPINRKGLLDAMGQSEWVITLEENIVAGGIGTMISEILCDASQGIRLHRIGLEDKQHFDYGSRDWLHRKYSIDVQSVYEFILERVLCNG